MKKLAYLLISILASFASFAQKGIADNFSTSTLSGAWYNNRTFDTLIQTNNHQLQVTCNNDAANYNGFHFYFPSAGVPSIDVSAVPYVSVQIKSSVAFTLRIDMSDVNKHETNLNPIASQSIVGDSKFHTYLFNFSGKFYQEYGSYVGPVDSTKIQYLTFLTNAGTGFTGTFLMDSVEVGSYVKPSLYSYSYPKAIKLNQLGFFTEGYKKAAVVGSDSSHFYLVKSTNIGDTLFTGTLSDSSKWVYSQEYVRMADFTSFNTPGTYIMLVHGVPNSYPFTISDNVLNQAAVSSIKGFYYQRASTPLTAPYAGIWTRAEGLPDTSVLIHPSAVSPGRPMNSKIKSPKGWFDAGDYNKYVVNAGISTYTLLSAYEHFSTYYDTLFLNIPESHNGIPDILDETLWEIRWLFTMQDPHDGGVYHKLTNLNFFSLGVMPANATSARYVVEKSTQASYDFAAIMAQSARIFSQYPTLLPGLADSCINAAASAYVWAQASGASYYNQAQMNALYPTLQVNTGTYEDLPNSYTPNPAADEQYWAAAELYTTTQNPKYYPSFSSLPSSDIPNWNSVSTLGLITLSHYRKLLPDISSDTASIKAKITSISNKYRNYALKNSAYDIAMGTNTYDFSWGSNGQAANESFVLLEAFNYTKDSTFLYGAVSNVDYLLGRNAPGYCFVTGLGSNSPVRIHQEVSSADGVSQPTPGLLSGGPNNSPDPSENCKLPYPYGAALPAFNYLDQECSYSTNEIAINWNAPFVFATGAIQSLYSGISPFAKPFKAQTPTVTAVVNKINTIVPIQIYPNPSSSVLHIDCPFAVTSPPMIYDVNGFQYKVNGDWSSEQIKINTNELSPGMYFIHLQGRDVTAVQKFTVMR
jgi:endoglucanase